ncbi:MAG TPA: hypothetical protein VEJ36_00990 [Nitrososphaerales archaeon]|nr:hypothetical protein [Nitrososphaerales archaeon]
MVSRGNFIGIAAVLVALLLVVSILAGFYYIKAGEEETDSSDYASELSTALASNTVAAGGLAASLSQENSTLVLLGETVSGLNTSSSAYKNASAQLPVLWKDYLSLAKEEKSVVETYSVRMLLVYGNGTKAWYNDTVVQPGWNLYVSTLVLLGGRVNSTWYPAYSEHYVTGLNGVQGNSTASWFLWQFSTGAWQLAESGADGIQAVNGTVYAWTLCGYNQNYTPTCSL